MTTSGVALAEALDVADQRPVPDVAPGALLIAAVEYPAIEPTRWLDLIEQFGLQALEAVNQDAGVEGPLHARVEAVNRSLFTDLGFHGNRDKYTDVRNSCLNQVLSRRTGIPITLSVVYMDVARRAGLKVEGVNFPGHFLVRVWDAATGNAAAGLVIDPFDGGAILTDGDCRTLLAQQSDDMEYTPDLLARATRRQMFSRMLMNLKRLYVQNRSFPQARVVTDALLAMSPGSLDELRDRGLLAYHLHEFAAALRDLEEYLRLLTLTDRSDDAHEDTEQVWNHVKTLRRRVAALN